MGKKAILILATSLMLISCGGNSSSSAPTPGSTSVEPSVESSESTSEPASSPSSSSSKKSSTSINWFDDWTPDTEVEYEYEKYEIAVGGKIQSIPDRFWNPEAAYDNQRFVATEDDHNVYELTIDLDAGDTVLFFFNYSWNKILDYDDVDWYTNEDLKDVDSYVSDKFEGEDVSGKFTEIHILKKAKYSFRFDAFGTTFRGLKSGMELVDIA